MLVFKIPSDDAIKDDAKEYDDLLPDIIPGLRASIDIAKAPAGSCYDRTDEQLIDHAKHEDFMRTEDAKRYWDLIALERKWEATDDGGKPTEILARAQMLQTIREQKAALDVDTSFSDITPQSTASHLGSIAEGLSLQSPPAHRRVWRIVTPQRSDPFTTILISLLKEVLQQNGNLPTAREILEMCREKVIQKHLDIVEVLETEIKYYGTNGVEILSLAALRKRIERIARLENGR